MQCSNCNYQLGPFDTFCPRCKMAVNAPAPVQRFTQPGQISPLLKYSPEGHLIGVTFDSVPEAKLVIKELKLVKKGFQAEKKEVAAAMAQIRADSRSQKITRGPAPRGSGFLMGVVKAADRVQRHNMAMTVDEQIRVLEAEKTRIESNILEIDKVILQVEKYVLEHKGA